MSAGLVGIAGLSAIAIKGTVGGPIMSVGFGLYGAMTTVAAIQTYRYARARRFNVHRAWAIRLFALVMGSWLFRMEYGFWIALTGGLGSTQAFTGPFDHVMAFFFYLPNLVVAEFFIRLSGRPNLAAGLGSIATLTSATTITLVSSYFFVRGYWGPAILSAL